MRTGVPRKALIAALVCLLVGLPGVPVANAQAPAAGDSPRPPPSRRSNWRRWSAGSPLPGRSRGNHSAGGHLPLDIVQADRFLQKLKQDKSLKPDDRWDESIRNLLNYPRSSV